MFLSYTCESSSVCSVDALVQQSLQFTWVNLSICNIVRVFLRTAVPFFGGRKNYWYTRRTLNLPCYVVVFDSDSQFWMLCRPRTQISVRCMFSTESESFSFTCSRVFCAPHHSHVRTRSGRGGRHIIYIFTSIAVPLTTAVGTGIPYWYMFRLVRKSLLIATTTAAVSQTL